MAIQRTLSLVKPDAFSRGQVGAILGEIEAAGLRIVASKTLRMTRKQAEGFYAVHRERPFFGSLCDFMTSGPVVVQVLEGDGAIAKNREIMGATDSQKAEPGTIRNLFGTNIEKNAVHGSDAPETAQVEIGYFFAPYDINGLG